MTTMGRDELLELERTELTVDVATAGRPFGIGRSKSYDLAKRGEFPVTVLTIGDRYRVRTAELVAAVLGQSESVPTATADTDSSTSTLGQENGSQDHASPLHAA
jgi:hypothetical protein